MIHKKNIIFSFLRCKIWIEALQNPALEGLTPEALNHRRVCEEHFEATCYRSRNSRHLNENAVPTKALLGN